MAAGDDATSTPTWTGTAQGPWAMWLGGAILVGAIATVPFTVPGSLPLFVAALVIVSFARVSVAVGPDGLVVRSPFGYRVRFRPHQIEAVEAIDVRPTKWGGWGYRGSVKVLGKAAWVVRGGEGIRIDLADERVFAVTVDDAEAGAAALQAVVRSTPR